MRTLILGLGNPVHRDDGVGGRVARELGRRFNGRSGLEVVESAQSGLSLIDLLVDYDRAFILDAVPTGPEDIGRILIFDTDELADRSVAVSPHYTGLPSVLRMGRELSLQMPARTTVIGIGVADPFTFDEKLSPELEKAVPDIVERVAGLIEAG